MLADPNHIRAFVLTASLVLATFTVVPYLPNYLCYNVGLEKTELAYMYLTGGLASIVTLTYFGRLADRLDSRPDPTGKTGHQEVHKQWHVSHPLAQRR